MEIIKQICSYQHIKQSWLDSREVGLQQISGRVVALEDQHHQYLVLSLDSHGNFPHIQRNSKKVRNKSLQMYCQTQISHRQVASYYDHLSSCED